MKTALPRKSAREDAASPLGHLTHDLQQPLTALDGVLEIGLLGVPEPAEYRTLLQGALREVERAAWIAGQIRVCISSEWLPF